MGNAHAPHTNAPADEAEIRVVGAREHNLKSIDLAIPRDELIVFTGLSGSGKSSLLSLLAGQIAPTSGRVLLDGHPIQELAPRERARQVAWLAQSPPGAETFAVLDVVGWGATAHSQASKADAPPMAEVIKQFGLPHLADAPLGSLSGGERQRVAIARALVNEPACVLMDEPTGNLDPQTAEQVLVAMEALKERQTAFVVVTHDPGIASRMDRQLNLTDGRLEVL